MALFHITIEKVIVRNDDSEVKELLQAINKKLDGVLEDPSGEQKQKLFDKLVKIIADVKSTV
jgi:hypothetical protein